MDEGRIYKEKEMEFKLKTLTPIWTGGVEGKPDKLHLTGIKGSIRWWYEVLVRGLDGYACNPGGKNSEDKCEFNTKSYGKTNNLDVELKKICPACQIFGCTNWGGKVILRIDEEKGKGEEKEKEHYEPIKSLFNRELFFVLRFIERKSLTPEEKKLIKATVKLIVEYGALGGRTTLKPSETPYKNYESYPKKDHLDYGLIVYQEGFSIQQNNLTQFTSRIKNNNNDYPDLNNFWFISGAHIDRLDHNRLVKRKDSYPKAYRNDASDSDVFMGGYIKDDIRSLPNSIQSVLYRRNTESDGESKKIFSFHGFPKFNGGKDGFSQRCFGYARDVKKRDEIADKVKDILKENTYEFKTGPEVLNEL